MPLVRTEEFNINNLIFSAPEENQIPASKLKFKRINIKYEHNNDIGDFILKSPPNLKSWGLAEQNDLNTNALNGYTVPMVLYSRPGGTDEEKKFVETINAICDKCKHHLVEHRDDIEKWNLEESDLKRFNPLYWKRGDRGNIIEERGPTLYAKVMYSKKTGDIYTNFIDQQNGKQNVTPLDPKTGILNKHLENVSFGIKIESIFIGSSIMSLQLKLSEVAYSLKDTTLRSLLNPNIILSGNKNDVPKMEVEVKNEDHHNDDDKEEEEEVEEEIEEEVEEVEEEEVEEEIEEVEEEEVEEEVVEVVTPSVPTTKSKTGTTTRQARQRKVKA